MKLWVFTCNDSPLEHWLDGFKERFDAWEAGGVRGLVVGFTGECSLDLHNLLKLIVKAGVKETWQDAGARSELVYSASTLRTELHDC